MLCYCVLGGSDSKVKTRSEEDKEASAFAHGKRIASTLLDEVYGTRYYASLGRGFRFAIKNTF